MKHNIRLQSWGYRVAVVCTNCTLPGRPETALLRSDDVEGLTLADAQAVGERHVEAIREAEVHRVESERVEGQVEFGAAELGPEEEPPLVAYGPADEFGPGYHPRTGQKFDTPYNAQPIIPRGDGGPSVREYLESKGEL